MPYARQTYDQPWDAALLIYADDCAAQGAAVSVDGTMIHVDWPDPRPLDERKAALQAQLADRRWTASLSCVWNGAAVPCDSQAATNVMGAIVGLQLAASDGPIRWKTAAGFVSLTLAQIIDLGQTMRLHVQACFDNEAAIGARVAAAADQPGLEAIDLTAGWPL